MYRAKEHGRSNFQFYTSEMNERVNERLALENALRRALERQELILHYQQKVEPEDRADRRRRGAGALAAPGVGPGAPGALHPARRGDRPDRQHRRMGAARGLPPVARLDGRRPQPGVVSVNLSVRQFRQEGLVRTVSRILEETRLDPAQLEMELTESMVMGNVDQAIAVLQGLKQLGVALSVDDFGTGYSSLVLPQGPADRHAEDRPLLRARHRRRRRGRRRRARAGHHLARPRAAPEGDRRGRRDRRAAALPAAPRLRRGAGLLLRRAGGARRSTPSCWKKPSER